MSHLGVVLLPGTQRQASAVRHSGTVSVCYVTFLPPLVPRYDFIVGGCIDRSMCLMFRMIRLWKVGLCRLLVGKMDKILPSAGESITSNFNGGSRQANYLLSTFYRTCPRDGGFASCGYVVSASSFSDLFTLTREYSVRPSCVFDLLDVVLS